MSMIDLNATEMCIDQTKAPLLTLHRSTSDELGDVDEWLLLCISRCSTIFDAQQAEGHVFQPCPFCAKIFVRMEYKMVKRLHFLQLYKPSMLVNLPRHCFNLIPHHDGNLLPINPVKCFKQMCFFFFFKNLFHNFSLPRPNFFGMCCRHLFQN